MISKKCTKQDEVASSVSVSLAATITANDVAQQLLDHRQSQQHNVYAAS